MAWVLDLDGVVWLADQPIAGAAGAVARLRAAGHRVLFVTNNSSVPVAAHRRPSSSGSASRPPATC